MELQKQKVLVPNIFQFEALQALEETQQTRSSGVVVMPTGTGKTFLASLWFRKQLAVNPYAKLLFVCHNRDILSQANEGEFQKRLKDLEISFGYYTANRKNVQQCTFATTQTLVKNLDKFDPEYFDYIIVDEAHHYQAKTFKKAVKHFNPSFLLGLTATPNRTDGKEIYDVCGKKVYEATIYRAMKEELLCKIDYYCVENDIDFSNIKWNGKKYDKKDLNKKICVREYDESIFEEYIENVSKRKNKTIGFCATVEHCHRMAKYFNEKGVKAIALTGNYLETANERIRLGGASKKKRNKIIQGFKDGEYDIIFVRDLFNEGVDVPDCDSIMMLRPTQSSVIFTQQIGRGLRKSPHKKDVLILDFTGNCKKCEINFQVLSQVIGKDVSEEVKKKNIYDKNIKEIVIVANGSRIVLTKNKIDILNSVRKKPSKEFLVEEYFMLKKKLGRRPYCRETKNCGFYYKLYWGSFTDFLMSINEPVYQDHRSPSKKQLIEAYYYIKKELGRQPRSNEMRFKNGVFDLKKYNGTFGSWKKFLREINEPLNQNNVFSKDVTEEELIENYWIIRKKLKRKLTSHDIVVKKGSKYGMSKYIKKFGSWNDFLEKIGENPRFLNINQKEIEKELNRVNKKLQKIPSRGEYDNIGKINSATIIKKYGRSWKDVLEKKWNFKKEPVYKIINCKLCNKEKKTYHNTTYCSKKCRQKDSGREIECQMCSGIFYVSKKEKRNAKFCSPKCYTSFRRNNIKVVKDYKPKTVVFPVEKKKTGRGTNKSEWGNHSYSSKDDKENIRSKIIEKIEDNDKVLLLESPDLSALKEIEKQGKKPSKIVIPNHLEFKKLAKALQSYKTKLKIEVVNTSALQYLVDCEEKFDFIWLDYCGAFSYYVKDLDILFTKSFEDIKLILTYNLFDPIKSDDSYYFTRVIDYVLEKTNGKSKVRLIKDISYRYKKTMYNIGFKIKNEE